MGFEATDVLDGLPILKCQPYLQKLLSPTIFMDTNGIRKKTGL
jgi:hypothetical protein